ncbi:LysR substrate-binding domain-containing protein [Oceanisphaera sp. KMM 10153]|uniref:LysR substrate-binding domain-containing protein n=1 Tax=Oceanisphaera submarina TaxID=3390193 RepID=UPI0039761850
MQYKTNRLPPLNALLAFETAARYQSLTRAAAELCVTQGAISQRVKQLEDFLNVKLFIRRGSRIELTDEARSYLPLLSWLFESLKKGTDDLFQGEKQSQLTLRVAHSFAEHWLIPRLSRFRQAHPGIQLRILATSHAMPDEPGEVDLEIINGYGNWPDREAEQLTDDNWVVVASPELLIRYPADAPLHLLSSYPKLGCYGYREGWRDWFRQQDPLQGYGMPLMEFSTSSLAIAAALQGLGLLLVRYPLVRQLLERRELGLAHSYQMPSQSNHYLLIPPHKRSLEKIRVFRQWLLQELAQESAPQKEII